MRYLEKKQQLLNQIAAKKNSIHANRDAITNLAKGIETLKDMKKQKENERTQLNADHKTLKRQYKEHTGIHITKSIKS